MPSPVIHLGVAVVALLLYFHDRHRAYALLLLPLAVLPDLDHFVPFYAPRVYFHTVFILVPALALTLYGWAAKRRVLFDVGLMGGFCLLSHLVLDSFNGGEALFYPLTTARYGFLGRPEFVYEILADRLLPKSVWPYSVEALGIMMCIVVFAGILVAKKRFQLTMNAPGTA